VKIWTLISVFTVLYPVCVGVAGCECGEEEGGADCPPRRVAVRSPADPQCLCVPFWKGLGAPVDLFGCWGLNDMRLG
jgi:hypothetical protein